MDIGGGLHTNTHTLNDFKNAEHLPDKILLLRHQLNESRRSEQKRPPKRGLFRER